MKRDKERDSASTDLAYEGGKLRLFVEAPLRAGASIPLDDAQSHYLLHVMRARENDRVLLFNGTDGEWRVRVSAVSRRRCTLTVEAQTETQTDVPDLWFAFAPIKKMPSDYLAQKATELGARVLQPVITHRTIARRVNLERLRANAVEAAEQSGRLSVRKSASRSGWPRCSAPGPRSGCCFFATRPATLHLLWKRFLVGAA
jgi:16S rRNA (uracil1498-N3)-methyltransferase